MGSARRRAGADDQDRCPVRPLRSLLGRRLPQLLARREDDHRLRQREGRRARQVQDRAGRRRRPVEGRGRDQRGRAAAQRREGGRPRGHLLLRPRRPARGESRQAEEVPLDHHRHRRRGAQGPAPSIHVPAAGQRRLLRRELRGLRRALRAGQAEEARQGRARRHHLRGRALRRGRGRRQRGGGEEAGHAGRAQGRLLDPGARSLLAGDQAALAAAGRAVPHRLQPGHRALPAPGQGAGPAREGVRRARRRPQPARQAEGDLRQRGGGLPHRRSARLAAHRSQEAEARPRRPHAGDAAALQGLRAHHPARAGRAARVDGLQQHVGLAQRRAAARYRQTRRLRSRGAREGGA